jgi:hypothetical protein
MWTSYTLSWVPLIKAEEREETVYVNLMNIEAIHNKKSNNTISIYVSSGQCYKSCETIEEFFKRIGKVS